MPQSLSKVYVHVTFSTKGRLNLIDEAIQERLFDYLGGICKGLDCNPVKVGGYRNHIHLLCLLSRKITQAEFVEQLKKQSSKWIKTIDNKYANFFWQNGYGIFSVNPSEVEVVEDYISNQKNRHKTRTFEEEFRMFLNKYNLEYDERYVWD